MMSLDERIDAETEMVRWSIDTAVLYWDDDCDDDPGYLTDYLAPMAYRHGQEIDGLRRDWPEVYRHLAEYVAIFAEEQVANDPDAVAGDLLLAWEESGNGLEGHVVSIDECRNRLTNLTFN